MKRTLLLVLVVVVGFAGGTVAPATVAGSATTAESMTMAESATGADATAAGELIAQADETEFPPGLNESGVTDPLALTDAHRETLENTSYTMLVTSSIRAPNGTVFSQGTTTHRIAAGGDSYVTISAQMSENATEAFGFDRYHLEVWANGTDAVVARDYPGNETSYEVLGRSDAPMPPTTGWERLYSAFGMVNTTYVGEVERNGTTLHKVVSTGTGATDDAIAGGTPDYTALIDSDGVVRSFRATQHSTYQGQPVVITRTMRFTEIGDTTVERPDWYGQAVGNESEGGTE